MLSIQQKAAHPAHSVWVSASAGTGKTKVLTDRVLNLLLRGVNPAKILCLTFTKAAAAEMSERIFKELSEWSFLTDEELRSRLHAITGETIEEPYLSRARSLFTSTLEAAEPLNIQTIHSFSHHLLMRFPLEAGITPHMKVLDEQTALELWEEAKLDMMRQAVHSSLSSSLHEAASALIGNIPSRTFKRILEEILVRGRRLQEQYQHYGLEEIIKRTYTLLGAKQGKTVADLKKHFCENFEESALRHIVPLLLQGSKTDIKCGEGISCWLEWGVTERLTRCEEYISCFVTQKKEPLKRLITKAVSQRHPEIIEIIEKEQHRVMDFLHALSCQQSAIMTRYFHIIAECVLTCYQQHKQRSHALDYQDIIYLARILLQQQDASWILYKLDGGIDHILIDEAQDTSPDQWDIIKILCQECFSGQENHPKTVFIVGDEKQSIYSFQGADLQSFERMREYFTQAAQNVRKDWHILQLDCSFRSTPAVLHVVDQVFQHPKLHDAIQTEALQHKAFRSEFPGKVECWPLVASSTPPLTPWPLPNIYVEVQQGEEELACRIAHKIATWIQEERRLAARGKIISPGDIMILVRRRTYFTEAMVKALKRYNVPVAGLDRLVLKDYLPIKDLIVLAQALLLPQDELSLATLLKTPFCGLDDEDLFILAYSRGVYPLWQCLQQHEQYQSVWAYLHELRKRITVHTPFEFYTYVLDVQKGRQQLIACLGEEVDEVINEFLSLTRIYEQSHIPSLQGFIHWLECDNLTIKREMEANIDAVRIMTIHGAKGLQAPIVFLPDTVQTPINKDILLWSEGMMIYSDPSYTDNVLCQRLREKRHKESMAEYYRLLYVAMTRAEDELYIAGWELGKSLPAECWYECIKQVLQNIGEEKEGILTYSDTIPEVSAQQKPESDDKTEVLPDYFWSSLPSVPALPELTSATAEILFPLSSSLPLSIWKEEILYRLLSWLPRYIPSQRREVAALYLKHQSKHQSHFSLSSSMIEEILCQLEKIFAEETWQFLWHEVSLAEVPMIGEVKGRKVKGRIDRLCIFSEEVIAVDYKSDVPAPSSLEEIPKEYLTHMALYFSLLSTMYPDKKIRCGILWLNTLSLMWLEEILEDSLRFAA